ncbi:ketoacyl-synthetase C-terminal extension domain-containing protein, partial [Mycobacterium avium]
AIPPSLHFERPDPDIDLNRLGLRVNTALAPWPDRGGPRRAGVSSFGMGGTNAHVIVEQDAAQPNPTPASAPGDVALPWVVSARSAEALAGQARRLLDHVTADAQASPLDMGWSLVS